MFSKKAEVLQKQYFVVAKYFCHLILTHFPKGLSRGVMFKTQVHVQIRGKSLMCTRACHDYKNGIKLNWC